jgi:hypothetical protein
MRALKNKKRITKNTEFIENYARTTIENAENVVLVDLFHETPLTMRASKIRIRELLQKFRSKYDLEYLLLTNLENQNPKHKMLFTLNGPPSKFQEHLEREWKNFHLEIADKGNPERYAQRLGDFYCDAAETVPFSNQNSKSVKSKLFQRSRIKVNL